MFHLLKFRDWPCSCSFGFQSGTKYEELVTDLNIVFQTTGQVRRCLLGLGTVRLSAAECNFRE